MIVNRVPGNFHIANHHRSELVRKLMSKEPQLFAKLSTNYKINHLSFGHRIDDD